MKNIICVRNDDEKKVIVISLEFADCCVEKSITHDLMDAVQEPIYLIRAIEESLETDLAVKLRRKYEA